MKKVGIVTRFEEPKPVGNQPVEDTWSEWRCPHIFGGIPATAAGVVTYPMKRDEAGTLLAIEGLTDVLNPMLSLKLQHCTHNNISLQISLFQNTHCTKWSRSTLTGK
jgi:hypothetical protein